LKTTGGLKLVPELHAIMKGFLTLVHRDFSTPWRWLARAAYDAVVTDFALTAMILLYRPEGSDHRKS